MTSKPSAALPTVVFVLGALLLAYWPVLSTPFGFSDDYYQLAALLPDAPTDPAVASREQLAAVLAASGRYVQWWLVGLAMRLVDGIADLYRLRLVGIVSLTLALLALDWASRRSGIDAWPRAALCVMLGTSLPAQILVSMAHLAATLPALIAAGGAFVLASLSWERREQGRRGNALWLGVAAAGLLTVAFVAHAALASYYWVPAAAAFLGERRPGKARLSALVWHLAVFACAGALALLPLAWGMAHHPDSILNDSRTGFTTDIAGKAAWFVALPLVDSLNIGLLVPSRQVAGATGLGLLAGLLLAGRGPVPRRLLLLALALLHLPLAYLPNLISRESWSSYRTQLGLEGVVLVFLVFGVCGAADRYSHPRAPWLRDIALAFAVALAVREASHNTRTYFADPQLAELRVARRLLDDQALQGAREIVVVPSTWHDSLCDVVRYDEFGLPSTSQVWVPRALAYLVLRERGAAEALLPMHLERSPEPAARRPGTRIVDFRNLRQQVAALPPLVPADAGSGH